MISHFCRDLNACQLVIPNVETVKYSFIMSLFVESSKPFLLVGESGTGLCGNNRTELCSTKTSIL